MTIFYHHIIRRQMDSITRHLIRTRVMKIFFAAPVLTSE
ncbi:hypothetical protein SeGA_4844, partial [Salmonella enterica subsp. enterica serovar Gaminara str. A4-567]